MSTINRAIGLVFALVLTGAATTLPRAAPQATAGGTADTRFEVTSVKRNVTGNAGTRISAQPGGRLVAVNVPLRRLITLAYLIESAQLVGGPDWIETERFDITATATADAAPIPAGLSGPILAMMRNLLADRFQLKLREEPRELPVYALAHVREDKRLGPGLRPSVVECDSQNKADAAPPALAPDGRPVCGIRSSGGLFVGGAVPISSIQAALGPIVRRTIIDRTGLAGRFDIDLRYVAEPAVAVTPPGGGFPSGDADGTSIFTALREQLGLKLVDERAAVKVLVIEHVQRPTED